MWAASILMTVVAVAQPVSHNAALIDLKVIHKSAAANGGYFAVVNGGTEAGIKAGSDLCVLNREEKLQFCSKVLLVKRRVAALDLTKKQFAAIALGDRVSLAREDVSNPNQVDSLAVAPRHFFRDGRTAAEIARIERAMARAEAKNDAKADTDLGTDTEEADEKSVVESVPSTGSKQAASLGKFVVAATPRTPTPGSRDQLTFLFGVGTSPFAEQKNTAAINMVADWRHGMPLDSNWRQYGFALRAGGGRFTDNSARERADDTVATMLAVGMFRRLNHLSNGDTRGPQSFAVRDWHLSLGGYLNAVYYQRRFTSTAEASQDSRTVTEATEYKTNSFRSIVAVPEVLLRLDKRFGYLSATFGLGIAKATVSKNVWQSNQESAEDIRPSPPDAAVVTAWTGGGILF